VLIILKVHSIHQHTVERVVEGVIQVVAMSPILLSFANHSGG
jgi:hypothetical protein